MSAARIKLLHVTFDMKVGGTQQVIRQLVKHLDPARFECEIACIDNELGELGAGLEAAGTRVHLLERNTGFDLALVKSLARIIREGGHDIVHCHQYTPYFYGVLAALVGPARVIFTEHGRFYPDFGSWKRKLVNPLLGLVTRRMVSISAATREALVVHENFSRERIRIIYNGVDDHHAATVDIASLKAEYSIPPGAFVFGTISRLEPIKNQKLMIDALAGLRQRHANAVLLIVGDGESRAALEARVAEKGLAEQVIFTGMQNDVFRFHKLIDVFLLPSFSEGTSMTLLEAMSFEKPSVVTKVGGNPELVEHGVNGLVVDSDNLEQFEAACEVMISDADRREAMGQRARQVYQSRFSVATMVEQYQALYLESARRTPTDRSRAG